MKDILKRLVSHFHRINSQRPAKKINKAKSTLLNSPLKDWLKIRWGEVASLKLRSENCLLLGKWVRIASDKATKQWEEIFRDYKEIIIIKWKHQKLNALATLEVVRNAGTSNLELPPELCLAGVPASTMLTYLLVSKGELTLPFQVAELCMLRVLI